MGAILTKVQIEQLQHIDPLAADEPDYTNAVFGNDLLFDHIAEYLGTPDLKILRQTCKSLYFKVSGHPKFISSLRLTISDDTIRENGMCNSITWENVSIVVSRTSSQHFRNIQTDCIEDLELLHPTSEDLTQLTKDKDSRLASYEFLEGRQFPNLRSMTLDMNLLCHDIPIVAMASVVGTVKELRFQGVGLYDFRPEGEEGQIAEKNLEMLGGLAWKLHSFVIEGFRLSQDIAKAVGAIPASSASTLQELKLYSIVAFGHDTFIRGVRFPQLRSIGLEIEHRFGEYDGIPLAEFLDLLPQLNAIELNCQQLYRNARFAPPVLEAIRRICGSELHTLRLQGPIWLNSFPNFGSWEFIRDLTALKNCMISGMHNLNAHSVVAQILNYLPSRAKSLEFHNVKFNTVAQAGILAALTGFLNLVQLKINLINGSGSLENDVVLQAVCGSLIKLRVLHFGSSEVTDFGLTGERGNNYYNNYNSGVSIQNLKGLQDLDISGQITEYGILSTIQFPELRKLKLGTQISKSALIKIASHNTSLEYVACIFQIGKNDGTPDEYFRGLFSSIMAVNPRLTRFRILNLYMPHEGDIRHEVIRRPSYGVSANLTNPTTLLVAQNTMKIAQSSKGETFAYKYNYTYNYNIPN